ncbi:P-loop containing nucleoside triphosphate hydrolase protein [Sphaerosporella brunnea]|uniref:Cell division control protein n=1 Tax=Sphaerosporella brunnea TaxID=1250544 RepID=A0A5J5ESN4_9PEZI|nr:P-loop containing nucleoside triphosphate hydrolase protein [Sphaerosporella brunnea]KAA8901860.1 P-loop containing nucleoside triphosphate hydrolase protein [Sphaerosporella brunnea]
MPAAVLGKRQRPLEVVVKPSPRLIRSRRRISTILEEEDDNDEEMADTIVVRADPVPEPTAGIEESLRTPKRTRRSAPPKSGAMIPLSPQRANTVFKVTKVTAASGFTKENKDFNEAPPKTPRHRDAIKKPSTPRHRVCVVSKPMTPRSKLLATPTHAATPSTAITTAKSLFSRSTQAGRLIGRDSERSQLQSFLKSRFDARTGGCLYITGPPGCGKSALLTEIMGELAGDAKVSIKKAWINCMSLHTPNAIYASLLDSFSVQSEGIEFSDLEALFISTEKSRIYVLVLDEIDHLLSHDLLPTLFELSLRKNSRLILIGIANALDLADRFLPRMKAKNLEPELLRFLPYTAPQISEVLTARLRSLLTPAEVGADANFLPFVHPAAIQLLSKKVASASGDLRKAFDILRRALELVEMESLQALRTQMQDGEKPLGLASASVFSPARKALAETSLNSPAPRPTVQVNWTPSTAPRASLAHVAKASSATLGASISSRVAKLNAHQKAVLCVLVAKNGTTPWPLIKLKDAYSKACKDVLGLMPLVGAEFRGVVDAMEAMGVMDILPAQGKGKDREERAVARVGRMELLTAVSAEGTKGKEGLIKVLVS